ncbi:MAG: mechanosensitive ion channel family protein [Candidatus Micrarchaeota archaeon]
MAESEKNGENNGLPKEVAAEPAGFWKDQKSARMAKLAIIGFVVLVLLLVFFAYSALILDIIKTHFLEGRSLNQLLPTALNVLLLLVGTVIFLQITRFAISKHLENRGKKKEIKLILTLYSYIVWLFTAILILATIFKDLTIFFASLGLIGLGLTLALQRSILNFAGWLTIVINKPFNIGDRIEANGIRGDVLAIQSMYTVIQSTRPDSQDRSEKIVTLPNEFVLTSPVINFTKRGDLHWEDVQIGITYESNWKKAELLLYEIATEVVREYVSLPAKNAKQNKKSFHDVIELLQEASNKLSKGGLKEALRDNIETMKTIEQQGDDIPVPSVRVDLLDSAIGLNVLFVTDIRRVRDMRADICRGFLTAIKSHPDIEIAYPHMQLVLNPDTLGWAPKAKK